MEVFYKVHVIMVSQQLRGLFELYFYIMFALCVLDAQERHKAIAWVRLASHAPSQLITALIYLSIVNPFRRPRCSDQAFLGENPHCGGKSPDFTSRLQHS